MSHNGWSVGDDDAGLFFWTGSRSAPSRFQTRAAPGCYSVNITVVFFNKCSDSDKVVKVKIVAAPKTPSIVRGSPLLARPSQACWVAT